MNTLRRGSSRLGAERRYFHIVLDANDDEIRRAISIRTPSTPLRKYFVDRKTPLASPVPVRIGAYFVGIPLSCAVSRLHHFVARARVRARVADFLIGCVASSTRRTLPRKEASCARVNHRRVQRSAMSGGNDV